MPKSISRTQYWAAGLFLSAFSCIDSEKNGLYRANFMARIRESWNSRAGVILAVTGSAVGLGNFLRFPGLAAKYEGGAFMIAYFVALLLLGIPLAWAEWAMGRYGGSRGFNSVPGIFRALTGSKWGAYLGVLGLIVPVVIYMYYVFIESWCLGYAWKYLTGAMQLGREPEAYARLFSSYTAIENNGSAFEQPLSVPLVCLGVCVALNFFLIYRGLNKGIEFFCKWAMPLLILCALIVLVRVLTLGTPDPARPELNVLNALGFMWSPDFGGRSLLNALRNPIMWMEAAGQIFFSLSTGFGVIITYSSYLRAEDDIALSSTAAISGNEFCEVALGGMITVPAAFVFLGATGAVGSTFGLGFHSLPMVFAHMPMGQFFGFLWFFLLFLAAVTSSLSMLQPAIAFLEEGLGLNRRGSVSVLGFITLMGTGFIVWFSKGLVALDTFDFWVGTFCIFLLATVQTVMFGWVFGVKKGRAELDRGAHLHIPAAFSFVIKYISPVYLVIIFVLWARQNMADYWHALMTDHVVRLSMGFLVILFVLFLLLIAQAVRRWERQLIREDRP